jgi:Ca2+-binding RTX toxin-like protein
MAIRISVADANHDGKGINFAAYLKNIEKTYADATGRGDFSGKTSGDIMSQDDPLGAKAYVTTDSEEDGGRSVIFNSSGKFTYDFFGGHVISGRLQSMMFGTDTVKTPLSGDENVYSNSGDITIAGFAKNYVTTSEKGDIMGDVLNAKMNGLDSLYDFLQSDSIVFKGSTGKDVFSGYKHADTLNGGAGADKLDGGAGKDRIDGDTGNDRLTGGLGADTFHFAKGDGNDRITDFDAGKAGKDVIAFGKGLFDNYADVIDHARDVAAGVQIHYDGGKLTLLDVDLADLHKGDFHLL